jgi:uncharacterized protein
MSQKNFYYCAAALLAIVMIFAVNNSQSKPKSTTAKPSARTARARITVQIDKTECRADELLKITGKAPKGKPVFIEVASGKNVEVRRLDSKKDKDTGKVPWIYYTSDDVPAYYTTLIPTTMKDKVQALKAQKDDWSYSGALKELGINPLGLRPDEGTVEWRKTSIIAVITGSRGKLMEPMDNEGDLKAMLPLYKLRFKSPGVLLKPAVDMKPDGSFAASLKLPKGSADGVYTVTAFTDNKNKATTTFTMMLPKGTWYFERAGMAMNIFGPFFLALIVTMLGVLMGAGGGFILTPLLLWIYGLPHPIVAGTVLPTVLFSQASGVYNYHQIKFINWKLGIVMGTAMLAGGFIGPVITQMITLSQYKSWFGIVLFILAGLMLWQTMPSRIAKNRHEQEILKQFKKKAEETKKK